MAIYHRTYQANGGTSYTDRFKQEDALIYGSARLGNWHGARLKQRGLTSATTAMTGVTYSAVPSDFWTNGQGGYPTTALSVTRELGLRQYELSNHLGNVLSTVSDRRLAVSSGSVLAYYRADEKSYADYDPYGMLLPGRFGGGFADQKFGFQGQLKDDELNGSAGSSYAFEYRVHDPRVGRFFSVDPLSSQQPWYSPYNFAGNNPVACIDYKGGRPIYGPGWSMGTLMLSHTNFFAVLVESNNSSPLLMHKYATGAEHTNAQRRAWHYSLVGSMGEAIVGENALWNFGLHGMFHGHNTFPYIRYGVYYGGAPVDIAITCNTGTRRRLWSNALSERTFVMMPTYDPVTWEKTGDAEYGSQNGVEQRWTILVEVKTLNPEGDAETIFYELSEGMQQLDRSISAAGERSIAWLQTDTDTWKRVMSDSTYGPKLRQAYNSYLAKGNRHIKLVDDLYNDAVNQLNEAQKDIQNANPTGN